MAATLSIEMPDELFEQLQQRALEQGKTPETVAVEYLMSLLSSTNDDRLLRWVGAFESSVPDAAQRHDQYLGQALYEELKGGQGP
jgi:hypothetical protein